jgi:hypothetical protein
MADQLSNQSVILAEAISSGLSLLGIAFIMLTFFLIPTIRDVPNFRCIIYLSISDAIFAIHGVVGVIPLFEGNEVICVIIGVIEVYGYVAPLLWTTVFAILLYHIANAVDVKHFPRNEWKYLVIGFGLPVLFAMIPLSLNDYSKGNYGCGISGHLTSALVLDLFEIVILLLPFMTVLIANIVLYCITFSKLRTILVTTQQKRFLSDLKYYPLILLFCWIWPIIYFVVFWITKDKVIWLAFIGAFCCKIQGFLNAFVYGFNGNVKRKIQEYYNLKFKRNSIQTFQNNSILRESVDYYARNDTSSNSSLRENV